MSISASSKRKWSSIRYGQGVDDFATTFAILLVGKMRIVILFLCVMATTLGRFLFGLAECVTGFLRVLVEDVGRRQCSPYATES